MSALISIVEGTTRPLRLTVYAQTSTQSAPVAYDLSGLKVEVVLRNASGVYFRDTTQGVTVTASTYGQLEYRPSSSSGDLFVAAQSPYRMRFRLVDSLGRVTYSPQDAESLIEVFQP